MLVISTAAVLALAGVETPDLPLVGWRNVVTPTTISATSQDPLYPASNLANPASHLDWRSLVMTEQYLTIVTNEVDPIDYIAVAGHNLASASVPVSVEGLISGVWTEIVEEVLLPDDGPALFRFEAQSLAQIRIRLQAGSDKPRAAVVYVGRLLVMERRIYAGHTPLPYARKTSIVNGRSESGKFLGRIEVGSWRETTIPLSLISPAWYRANMDAFLSAAQQTPFFFAWRSQSYPREVGFCWLTDDPMPAPIGPHNLLAFDLKVSGVA
ncbi:hypothetical protein [Bradyrhizobium sp. SZCCHNS3002]|uniref:hypothetical protein n=1 Tax=Bradyrhizobium sp. SZCCHNS3002 TaxID=3057310 RepID=UPI0028EE0DC6|nr:hypothetical protein [Bradyrhizobium sp. SZCCHNS3002]